MNLFDHPIQLLIPFIAAFVGWFTNVVAVKMMFWPLEFKGIKPFLGWQGIVPANAVRLASTGLKLVTTQLLKIPELFADFDAKEFVDEHGQDILKATRETFDEMATKHMPGWETMPAPNKEFVFTMVSNDVKQLSADVLDDSANRIEELMDIQDIVVRSVEQNPALMGDVFLKVGGAEFKFIERSGLYFGFVFGLIQLLVWLLYPANWVLPFFGFLVGYATNWLAIKLIFQPKVARKIGPFTVHGLFHRRQKEIAVKFAEINSEEIFTPDNLFNELSKPSSKAVMLSMVQTRAEAMLGKYQKNPMLGGLLTPELITELEGQLMVRVEEEMFKKGGVVYAFTNKSAQIQDELRERMKVMDADGFENVLRPAFQQDEWKLILAGAVLGLGAGVLQLVGLFGDLVAS
ncbi:MAG: uncharacterized membrane protein YheB (UPF0754 family) [Myxococcota bacterium]|jgi:uncharacterized membrane protein YheB (UPF0754 family)